MGDHDSPSKVLSNKTDEQNPCPLDNFAAENVGLHRPRKKYNTKRN